MTTAKKIWGFNAWREMIRSRPEQQFLVNHFVPEEAAILISGQAKKGFKSWFAFQVVICVVTGKPVSMLQPNGAHPVLFLEEEGPSRSAEHRFTMLETGSQISLGDSNKFYWSHRQGWLIDDESEIRYLEAYVKDKGIKLVVIDTLAKSSRMDENNAALTGEVLRKLDRLRNAGASVMFLHHIRKTSKDASEDVDEEVRGSSAIPGYYDVHLAFRRRSDSQKHLDLTVVSRDADEKRYIVSWLIEQATQSAQLGMRELGLETVSEDLIADVVQKLLPGNKYTWKQLQESCQIRKQTAFVELVKELEERGILTKSGDKYVFNTPQEVDHE